jgi:hypothetical protein
MPIRKSTAQGLTLRAAIVPSTLDEARRSVDLTWSSGASVMRSNRWGEKFFEKLSLEPTHVRMERLSSGRAPLLAAHDGDSLDAVIGVVEKASIENGVGVCTVRFAKAEDDPFSDRIFRKVKDGIIQNVSVGYRPLAVQQLVENDAAAVPTLLVTEWEPMEISMVPMGEDPAGAVRSLDNDEAAVAFWPQLTRNIPKPKEPNMLTPEQIKQQQDELAKREAAIKQQEALMAEEKRKADITELVTRSAKREGFNAELGAKLIKENASVDQARAAVIDEFVRLDQAQAQTNKHTGSITGGETEDEKFGRGVMGGLLARVEGGDLLRRAREAKVAGFDKLDADNNEFRGLTMTDIARRCLERRNISTRGLSRMELVGLAFTTRSAAGYQGTSDFPVILENAMRKVLLAAYETQPDTWSRFCKVETLPDFRASPRYRLGSLTVLDAKNEHGEFQNKNIPDGQKTSISTGTKGNIIAVTRELIINDDMGALAGLSTALGRAARLSVETDVYALIAANGGLGPTMSDANPFFHASRNNIAAGAALSAAGLDADGVVMALQKDQSNNEILDLQPDVLLIARGLSSQAKILNSSAVNPDGGSGKSQVPNPVNGMFRDIVATARLAGTRRYIFANPQVVPAFIVAFLEEQGQAPVIESRDGWRVDGSELRVRFDYRAQAFDPKGAVTNAGA